MNGYVFLIFILYAIKFVACDVTENQTQNITLENKSNEGLISQNLTENINNTLHKEDEKNKEIAGDSNQTQTNQVNETNGNKTAVTEHDDKNNIQNNSASVNNSIASNETSRKLEEIENASSNSQNVNVNDTIKDNNTQQDSNKTEKVESTQGNQTAPPNTDQTNDKKIEHTKENQSENKNSNSTSNPTEQPQNDVIQPAIDEGIDYTKEFNLTFELEKLYNQSISEENIELKSPTENAEMITVNADNEKVEDEEESEEEKHRKEWEDKVSDFTASEIMTIKIQGKQHINLYEEINEIPSLLKVAYYVNDENQPLNFFIYSPQKVLIHKTISRGQDYHEFLASQRGRYKIVLDNAKFENSKKVTFAIHTGNNTDTSLKMENIDRLSKQFNSIEHKLEEVKLREKMIIKKLEGHYETTKTHNKQIVKYSIIETTTMIIILIVQMFYLKHLLKRVS